MVSSANTALWPGNGKLRIQQGFTPVSLGNDGIAAPDCIAKNAFDSWYSRLEMRHDAPAEGPRGVLVLALRCGVPQVGNAPTGYPMNNGLDRLTAALAERYRIERELGAGSMAAVYLAQDLRHERQVAIEVLRQDWADLGGWKNSQTVVKRYQRPSEEAQRAALDTRQVLQA